MGYYVNETQNGYLGTNFEEKCSAFLNVGAVELDNSEIFVQNMICVVDNGLFAAAAYLYNEDEWKKFTNPTDTRKKRFFQWDKAEEYSK